MPDRPVVPVDVALRRVTPSDSSALADLFLAIALNRDDTTFHPHPFTREEAERIACSMGLDIYCVAERSGSLVGYGMLRGWDEGFAVPSLGIVTAPAERGTGLGRLLMVYLHWAARAMGADRVRLKVYEANIAARDLYESLGYTFEPGEPGELIGYVWVGPARTTG